MTRLHNILERYSLFIGYSIFFIVIMGGFIQLKYVQELAEQRSIDRATVACERQNEFRMLLGILLDELAAPRESDGPGDFERRMVLREQVDHLVRPIPCDLEE